jgi:CheY-like chemotaxis protein
LPQFSVFCLRKSGNVARGAADNSPQTRDIPIIGMSAHAVESEREKAIATGCDEFDAKPIEFESLVATIRRVLAPRK